VLEGTPALGQEQGEAQSRLPWSGGGLAGHG
jgi:hypothetical protein